MACAWRSRRAATGQYSDGCQYGVITTSRHLRTSRGPWSVVAALMAIEDFGAAKG